MGKRIHPITADTLRKYVIANAQRHGAVAKFREIIHETSKSKNITEMDPSYYEAVYKQFKKVK